jgi:hypothetical protein
VAVEQSKHRWPLRQRDTSFAPHREPSGADPQQLAELGQTAVLGRTAVFLLPFRHLAEQKIDGLRVAHAADTKSRVAVVSTESGHVSGA